ncbi:MAG: transcription antitermination factor NusB [Chloroflexi bacterium]|nr:transcription antitermination factor NusB [Chloroflexota bacterium]
MSGERTIMGGRGDVLEATTEHIDQAPLRHPSGDEMMLTVRLREENGAAYLAEVRQAWEEGQKGEIATATLLRLVAETKTGSYVLHGEWRLHDAPASTAPALKQNLGRVEILRPVAASTDRSASRSVVLQLLYEMDCANHNLADALAHNEAYAQLTVRQREVVRQYARGIQAEGEQYDAILQRFAPDFPLDQLAIVDRNILRLALYEMFHSDRPLSAMIHEAVWLADVYGSEGAIAFVNGVLGNIAEERAALKKDVCAERPPERAPLS